jgi:putative intracellular protease/amidase
VASPEGGDAPVDPCSRSTDLEVLARAAKGTRPLAEVDEAYDAYLVVGGRGALWDLSRDPALGRLLGAAFGAGKVVAAVSQGNAGLLDVRAGDEPLVRGRRLTASTDREEHEAGWSSALPFSLERELVGRGARVESASPWANHVVTEGRLVTGQNPGSAESVARAVARLMAET